jgi:NitT/TauT family transport system substrate-binding protein
VISPDKALPFMIAAKKSVTAVKDLNGKVFGVARVGSADYALSRVVLAKLGADVDSLRYLAVGQPPVRAQALAAGQIDATTISIGVWLSMPDKSAVREMVDQASFYKAAPFVSKLNVVTEDVVKKKSKEIAGVVRGIIMASRDFAKDPKIWVAAMEKARPDVKPADLEALGEAYRKEWSVNGGLNIEAVKFTTKTDYKLPDFKDLRPVEPKEWIDTSFIDATLKDIGTDPSMDETGR